MRSSLAFAFALAPALAPGQGSVPAPPVEVVERIVAVVDERPLLQSEVRALRAVRGLTEGAATEAAIEERLMYLEAARLPQAEVSREEEDEAVAPLLAAQASAARPVPEADLRRLVRRQVAILKYVAFRFRPQVRVSDEEVGKALEEEGVARPAESAREEARARLERRALDERIEAWVRELRARADVRYVGAAPGP